MEPALAAKLDAVLAAIAALPEQLRAGSATANTTSDGWLARLRPVWLREVADIGPVLAELHEKAQAGEVSSGLTLVAIPLFFHHLGRLPLAATEAAIAEGQRLAELASETLPDPTADKLAHLEHLDGWVALLNEGYRRAGFRLQVRAPRPGEPVDPESMETVRSEGGNRLAVRRCVTPIFYDKTADVTRLVRRARIVAA